MALDIYIYRDRFITYDKINFIEDKEELFNLNITHNLNKMAKALGCYQQIWRPEELEIITCEQLIPVLESTITKLKMYPENYIKYNSINCWGNITDMFSFLNKYYLICKKYPNAKIEVSR